MRAAFHTLGCKVNSYETEAILEQFKALGYEITEFSSPADVYVVNTCSVTQMAEHKSRQLIHRTKKLNPDAIVVATGCYAQRVGDELLKDDFVDVVVGNNRKSEIARIATDFLEDRAQKKALAEMAKDKVQAEGFCADEQEVTVSVNPMGLSLVDDLTQCRDYESQAISSLGENVRAYVKIQDGCNRFCSYCIIPYVRGRSRIRSREEILSEVKTLADNGYKEIVLTGIDISMYENMMDLIEDIAQIEGIERIRLGSLEAGVITEEFIERFAKCPKACPHFHLSLQSGCGDTLKRMNRHYTPEEFAAKMNFIREHFEICAITTDVIVGFAGETEQEFEESYDFVEKMAFTQTHVFKYSRRAGTRADKMPNQVPEKVKTARSARMIEMADRIKNDYEKSLLGKVRPVLFEEMVTTLSGQEVQIGFTPEYIKVAVISDESLLNSIVNIRLTGFDETINGRVILGEKA